MIFVVMGHELPRFLNHQYHDLNFELYYKFQQFDRDWQENGVLCVTLAT